MDLFSYSLWIVCSGDVFGPDNRLDLRLLDIPPALETLQGVQMELDDCSFNLIDRITTTSDPTIAFEGADVVCRANMQRFSGHFTSIGSTHRWISKETRDVT